MDDDAMMLLGGEPVAAEAAPSVAEAVPTPFDGAPEVSTVAGGEEAALSAAAVVAPASHYADEAELAALLDAPSALPPGDDAAAEVPVAELEDGTSGADAAPPPPLDITEGLNFEDIFFHDDIPPEMEPFEDPVYADPEYILSALFGDRFDLNALHPLSEPPFRQAEEIRTEQARLEALELFGEGFPSATRDNLFTTRPPNYLSAPRPRDILLEHRVKLGDVQKSAPVWLVDLPTTGPTSRQTLHADPLPYRPESASKPVDSKRQLHTPVNTMRWTYDATRDKKLSNTRLVLWSDGSATLHVGSDVYEIFDHVQRELHMIGEDKPMTIEASRGKTQAYTDGIATARHVTLRAPDTRPNSVRSVLAESVRSSRAVDPTQQLAPLVAPAPELGIARSKNPPKWHAKESDIDRFMEAKRKEVSGRRMTFAAAMERELENFALAASVAESGGVLPTDVSAVGGAGANLTSVSVVGNSLNALPDAAAASPLRLLGDEPSVLRSSAAPGSLKRPRAPVDDSTAAALLDDDNAAAAVASVRSRILGAVAETLVDKRVLENVAARELLEELRNWIEGDQNLSDRGMQEQFDRVTRELQADHGIALAAL